jgi:hypothetical protein
MSGVGLDYWESELSSGRISKSVFILAVVNGAKGNDGDILDNKTQVGLKFAEEGLEDKILGELPRHKWRSFLETPNYCSDIKRL